MRILDAHLHLDLILREGEEAISFFKKERIGFVTWAYLEPPPRELGDFERYFERILDLVRRVRRRGIWGKACLGFHPRSIPESSRGEPVFPEEAFRILERFLREDEVCGIGEIGLERGDEVEEAFLRGQLEVARKLLAEGTRRKVCIHTPRSRKEEMTRRTLSLLEDFPELRDLVLIDHTTPKTAGEVLQRGFRAGVSLNEGKCSLEDVLEIYARFRSHLDRIILNTDSVRIAPEDYRLLQVLNSELPEEAKRKMLWENAWNFFEPEGR